MDKKLLEQIIHCISPSGKEEMLQKCLYNNYKNTFDEFIVREQGSLIGVLNKNADFKILLAAHADEISLIVTGHNSDGTLEVESNGGIRAQLYAGTKVQVLTNNGIYKGVVGTNSAINKNGNLKASDLFVDMGCTSKEEVSKLVPKGSYIVHDTEMVELQNNRLAARAFDDRIGVYIIFEAAKKAKEKGANIGIYVCATTGEETTGRGSYECSSFIKPNACVAVDVTYANDYRGSDESGDVEIGKGGVICEGSIPNSKLNELIKECAKSLNLPVQYEVFAGRTGTDADTMIKTESGITQTLFSIPLRYMHSPIELLSIDDVDSMVEILAEFLVRLNKDYSLCPYELK